MNKERYLNDQDRQDFLELITPFMDRIRLASEGKGRLTNKGQVKEYKTIFDKYIKDPKSEDLNIGCNNCMGLSYKQTIGKYERELKANGGTKMTFPKQEPIKITKSELISQTNLTKEEVYETHPTTMNFKLEKANDNVTLGKLLKWGEFKKFCTSVGISVKGKTRKELEQELKEL